MIEFGAGAVVGALLGSGATVSAVVGGTDGLGIRLGVWTIHHLMF